MSLEKRITKFVNYLVSLSERENRAALAALKRSLAFPLGAFPRAFPHVEPWTNGLSAKARGAFYLAAGLFAHHQKHEPGRNLPRVLAEYLRSSKGSESLELRFLALLEAGEDELPVHLRRLVFILHDRALDWEALLRDLVYWEWSERRVQVRWAREFYGLKENSNEEVKHETA